MCGRKAMENAPVCENNVVHAEAVEKARSDQSDREAQSLAAWFKLLSDPTRLKILLALAKAELCVCDLCALLNMSISAVSHQLNTLRSGRLVKYRREGKNIYYSLDDDHVAQTIALARSHLAE